MRGCERIGIGAVAPVLLGVAVETGTAVATVAGRAGAISTGAPEGDGVGAELEFEDDGEGGGALLGNVPLRDMR